MCSKQVVNMVAGAADRRFHVPEIVIHRVPLSVMAHQCVKEDVIDMLGSIREAGQLCGQAKGKEIVSAPLRLPISTDCLHRHLLPCHHRFLHGLWLGGLHKIVKDIRHLLCRG